MPFAGTGEANFLGGVARKYGADFDTAAAKKRFFELYLVKASDPNFKIGYPGRIFIRLMKLMAGRELLQVTDLSLPAISRHQPNCVWQSLIFLSRCCGLGESLQEVRLENSSCLECRPCQGTHWLYSIMHWKWIWHHEPQGGTCSHQSVFLHSHTPSLTFFGVTPVIARSNVRQCRCL